MTDLPEMLTEFFAEPDVADLRCKALDSYDLDICGVYCLHTGRQIGTFDDFVIQFAVREESTDDEECLIDALVARTIAGMRPSPMLNMPDRVTLSNLAAKYPVDVFAYLANRLQSNRYLATHRDQTLLEPYIARIHLHKRWTELVMKGVDARPWIHWLLELDAKRNLHDITPPGYGEFQQFLLMQVTPENADELLKLFESWAFKLLAEYDNRDRVAESQARWMRGNSLSQRAYADSWMANGEIARKKEVAKRPLRDSFSKRKESKASKVRQEKAAEMQRFLGLLAKVIESPPVNPTPQKRKAVPMTMGALLAKKESK